MPSKKNQPLPPVENVPAPTPEDLALLIARWNQYAPAKYKGLLEAEPLSVLKTENRQPKGRFVWDDVENVYRYAKTGKALTRREVAQAFLEFKKASSQ